MSAPLPGRLSSANPAGSVAQRVQHLFAVVRAPGASPYTVPDLVAWATDNGHTIAVARVYKILKGRSVDPRVSTLATIAGFFTVPVDVFTSATPPVLDGAVLDARIRLRDPRAQIMRATAETLDPKMIDALRKVVAALLRAERRPGLELEERTCPDPLEGLVVAVSRLSGPSRDAFDMIIVRLAESTVQT